jgi:predicted ribonuclease YlaK
MDAWKKDHHNLVLNGSAGTGKTFLALLLALELVLDKSTPFEHICIYRSIVPTRDVGFLPGSLDEKLEPFIEPYKALCGELFEDRVYNPFASLVNQGVISFESTSYLRGTTKDNTVMLVDEMQNLTFHELDSVMTRVGEVTRIIFCGDYHQSDLKHSAEKEGINKFLEIVEQLKCFTIINFDWPDIVRSGFVRDYIMTKEMMERDEKEL